MSYGWRDEEKEGEQARVDMGKDMHTYGKQTIKKIWFVGLKAVMDYFCECVEMKEKTRIVIDYDPREENTVITYYRATAKQGQEKD